MAAAAFAASHYGFELDRPAVIAGTELPTGTYRLEVVGDKVTIKGGKASVEAPVKMEEQTKKYESTGIEFSQDPGGKLRVTSISLGGTKEKVVFQN